MSNNINQNLCELIRKAQGDRTQNQFALQCGISSSALTRIMAGNYVPTAKTLQKIAFKAYNGVTYQMLLSAAGLSEGLDKQKNPANVYDVNGLLSFEVIGVVRAGYNGSVNEIPTGEIIEIPSSMISGEHKDDYFVLQVKGNSMYPRLLDGDKILCKRTNSVDSGSLAVVLYDGEDATVKRVNYVVGEDWLELVPYNPEYEIKRIEGADLEICRILGKVVKLIRDL